MAKVSLTKFCDFIYFKKFVQNISRIIFGYIFGFLIRKGFLKKNIYIYS